MTPTLVFGFLVLMALGVPLVMVLGATGLAAMVIDGRFSLLTIPQRMFSGIDSFPLMAVPFFILAADLMTASGITSALMRFANSLVGHIRGGLGHVNVITNTLFAGISGSALADAAGPGAILLRMMKRAGYDEYYSAALTAATATLGPLVPPSIIMVVYSITDNSVTVSGLFMAGIVPALSLSVCLAITNHIIAHRRGYRFTEARASWRQRAIATWKALPALLMPVIIIGGILTGIFTPTEAAAVAVVYAMAVGTFVTRQLTPSIIRKVFIQSSLVSSAALLIVSAATLFAWLLTVQQIPQSLATTMAGISRNPQTVIIAIAVFVLICGFFIDTLPAVLVLVPILVPLALKVGIDPLQLGMVVVVTLAIGMIHPPVGAVLFVVSSFARLNFERLSLAILPMLATELFVLVLVILFPQMSTALPHLLGYTH
jgi:tripartite ATP-independent transporter DctM subunit